MRPVEAGSLDHRAGKIRAARPPKRPLEERIRGHQEIELAYEEAEARLQAGRCRRCQVQTVFDRRLCILCGTCVDTCVNSAYKMVRLEDVAGDERLEGRLRVHYGEAWRRRPMTAIIKEEARCVRCGLCSRRCPTGAITLESFHVEEEWEDEGEHRGSLPRGES